MESTIKLPAKLQTETRNARMIPSSDVMGGLAQPRHRFRFAGVQLEAMCSHSAFVYTSVIVTKLA